MPTLFKKLTIAALAALALAGCSGAEPTATAGPEGSGLRLSDAEILDDPKSYVGESAAIMGQAQIEVLAENPDQQLPAIVTSYDHGGQLEVEVTDTSRVVAMDLAGSIAATIWSLGFGDSLVGIDQSATFAGTEDIPVVTGDSHSVNAEAVINLAPTLVITDGSIGPRDVIEQLRDVGITVVFVDNVPSFPGAASLSVQIGEIFGAPELGQQLADQITSEIDAKVAQIAEIAPQAPEDKLRIVFLYLRGTAGIYYLFGDESGADDLINGIGAIDVAGEMGWVGMRPMTDEALIQADPDLILVMSKGLESVGGVDGLLAEKPAVALTSAGKNRRIVAMDDGQVLSFGPRTADVLDALALAVYAPQTEGQQAAAGGTTS